MSRNETGQAGIPDPEVVPTAKRRQFSAEYKSRILEETAAGYRGGCTAWVSEEILSASEHISDDRAVLLMSANQTRKQ